MKKVSILMTVYNAEKYLDRVINNILSQSYSNFELIIVNDGSTDSSSNLINNYMVDERIIFIDRKVNKGRVYSLNEGLINCSTNYIFINDSDDISSIDRIEKTMNFYNTLSDNKIGMIGGRGEVKNLNLNQTIYTNHKLGLLFGKKSGILKKYKLYLMNPFIHSSVMYKKEALNKIGGFPNEVTSSIDYFTFLKISKFYNIYAINDILVTRQITGENYFMTSQMTRNNEKNIKIIRRWIKINIRFGVFYNMINQLLDKKIHE